MDPGEHDATDGEDEDLGVSVKKADVINWLETWPVTNAATHYAVVMDPKKGDILWLRRFLQPADCPSEDNSINHDDSESWH